MVNYLEPNSSSLTKPARTNDLLVPWRVYVGLFYLGAGLVLYLTSN